MWNYMTCKPQFKTQIRQAENSAHQRNLRNVKSSIDNKPPKQFSHLKHKAKKAKIVEGKA